MNEWMNWIKPELLVLIPVLYLIGMGLKKSAVKDKWIPLLLGGAGVAMSVLYLISAEGFGSSAQTANGLFTAVTQGILAAGGSVYCDQVIKQAKKEK